jgi:entericidin B
MACTNTRAHAIRVKTIRRCPAVRETKERMKRILIALLAAFVLSSVVTGCNTTRGAGEDIEHAGQKIQDKVDEHTNP